MIETLNSYHFDLTMDERFVLDHRMGWVYGRKHTMQEIADLLKLSKGRINQLEKSALLKLNGKTKTRNTAKSYSTRLGR